MIQTIQPEATVHKLKDLCCTRWIQRIDALDRIQALHLSIVQCLESISAEDVELRIYGGLKNTIVGNHLDRVCRITCFH